MTRDIQNKIAEFFTVYPLRVFNKRQIIISAEEPLPGVFYLIEGRVSQYDITPTGNEVVVNVFKPGAFFPMSTALNNVTNLYFYEASTGIKAHVAPPEDAVQFLQNNPDVALDLLARVYRGTDGVLRRMAHLMGGNARTRLLFELLNAAYRFGEVREDDTVFIPLQEGDIAKQSGLTRETVNRNIRALKTAGLLVITRNGLTIKNLKELEVLLGASV